MNTLKANLSKLVRAENRDGRDYLVAPVVLITEGVHNNIFYPAEELKKFPDAWNGRPLPLYHPQKNGTPITANSPDVIEAQAVGQVFNVNFENATDKHPARLKGEVWIDTAKLNALVEGGHHDAKALASMLHNNQPIEVSTGLFTDDELSAGKWNGEDYVAIARNHRPDHLALLPEGVGACSLADGCGTPRVNNEEGAQTVISRISGLVKRLLDKPKTNELTNRDKRAAIDAKLSQMTEIGAYTSIVDFGSDFVVYSQYREGEGEKMLRRDLTISEDDQVTIGSEVTEVTRRTEYIPAAPVPSPPIMATNTKAEETDAMENEKLVDALIANEATEFTADEQDRVFRAVRDSYLYHIGMGNPDRQPSEEEILAAHADSLDKKAFDEAHAGDVFKFGMNRRGHGSAA